jgi:hypothetical protein
MKRRAFGLSIAAAVCCLGACGDSSPTTASAVASGAGPVFDPPSAQTAPSSTANGLAGPAYAVEEFTCVNVETVRVRFSTPGFIEDDRVGLYVFFEGIPEGRKRLRVWWDRDREPWAYRDFELTEDTMELEEVYEHQYRNLSGPTEMLVRVELILDDLSGVCARNRYVVASPPQGGGGSPTGPSTPTMQSANVGPPIAAVDTAGFDSTEGVRFTASTALTIDSVWVSPNGPGTVVINLWDDTGSTLFNTTSIVVAAGPQPVSLGFAVQPGDYILSLDGTTMGPAGVGMTFGGASYPYQIPGVIVLTDTVYYWGFFGLHYYLYDWQISW